MGGEGDQLGVGELLDAVDGVAHGRDAPLALVFLVLVSGRTPAAAAEDAREGDIDIFAQKPQKSRGQGDDEHGDRERVPAVVGDRLRQNEHGYAHLDYLEDVDEILSILPSKLKDYENLIEKNPIFIRRVVNKGVLEKETALNYSITGVNLRSSGADFDTRFQDSLYSGFDIRKVILKEKDSMARYRARILEIKESMKIVRQALDYLKKSPALEQKLINPVNMKLPEGDYFADIEAPRGIASCFVRSYGEKEPYRLKWRTGSYYSVNLLRKLLVGEYLNDAIAIAGSLDIILPEVDK